MHLWETGTDYRTLELGVGFFRRTRRTTKLEQKQSKNSSTRSSSPNWAWPTCVTFVRQYYCKALAITQDLGASPPRFLVSSFPSCPVRRCCGARFGCACLLQRRRPIPRRGCATAALFALQIHMKCGQRPDGSRKPVCILQKFFIQHDSEPTSQSRLFTCSHRRRTLCHAQVRTM
jgi:hypothetical protein